MNSFSFILLFIGELCVLYFLKRAALKKSYPLLKRIFKYDSICVGIVALLYLPGTLVHEVSHYLVALVLNMHPSDLRLIPLVENGGIKLGHVLIEKKPHDSIRSTLVGVAPVFGGLATLWLLVQARLFPGSDIGSTLLFGYIILSVSANMFSSQQDLRDLIHLVPLALLIGIVWYLIPVKIPPPFIYFVTTIQYPLLFSIGFHALLIGLLSIKR